MQTLTEILDGYGSDKGIKSGDSHNYGAVYGVLFESRRFDSVRLLELGVATGSSVCAWLDYFPNGEIYGVDTALHQISGSVPRNNPRLHLVEGDAANPDLFSDQIFDFIIDDSNHVTDTQVKSLSAHWEKLRAGGLYIIEDLFVGELPWGGASSDRSFSFLWPYSGFSRSPRRHFFPRHPQDLFFLNRKGMSASVQEIMGTNEHFFTISSISNDGGLHMMLVIKKSLVHNQ